MAYFAEIDNNGLVLRVISISNDDAPDPAPANSEPLGQAFIANTLGLPGTWRQTSFSGSFRKQFAGPGHRYDSDADLFVAPQRYPSWTLDANHDWQPPTPYPAHAEPFEYLWDEDTLAWMTLT